jgi:hypothetical protein
LKCCGGEKDGQVDVRVVRATAKIKCGLSKFDLRAPLIHRRP